MSVELVFSRVENADGEAEVWTHRPGTAAASVILTMHSADVSDLRLTPTEARALGHLLIAAAEQCQGTATVA